MQLPYLSWEFPLIRNELMVDVIDARGREAVVARIERSFASAVYPGDDALVYDQSGDHLECIEVRDMFRGLAWRDVSYEMLVAHDTALSFFTVEAFRYYLPSYLLATINHFDEVDALPSSVVHYLTLPAADDVLKQIEYFRENPVAPQTFQEELMHLLQDESHRFEMRFKSFLSRMSGFSPEQGRAIRDALEYLGKSHADYYFSNEPQTAIERYWFIYGERDGRGHGSLNERS